MTCFDHVLDLGLLLELQHNLHSLSPCNIAGAASSSHGQVAIVEGSHYDDEGLGKVTLWP